MAQAGLPGIPGGTTYTPRDMVLIRVLSVYPLPEYSELQEAVARDEVIFLFHEVSPMAGVLLFHQTQPLANGFEVEVVLCVIVIVEVVDNESSAVEQDGSPLVLYAVILILFCEVIFATLDADVRPAVTESGYGQEIGKSLVGQDVFESEHFLFLFGYNTKVVKNFGMTGCQALVRPRVISPIVDRLELTVRKSPIKVGFRYEITKEIDHHFPVFKGSGIAVKVIGFTECIDLVVFAHRQPDVFNPIVVVDDIAVSLTAHGISTNPEGHRVGKVLLCFERLVEGGFVGLHISLIVYHKFTIFLWHFRRGGAAGAAQNPTKGAGLVLTEFPLHKHTLTDFTVFLCHEDKPLSPELRFFLERQGDDCHGFACNGEPIALEVRGPTVVHREIVIADDLLLVSAIAEVVATVQEVFVLHQDVLEILVDIQPVQSERNLVDKPGDAGLYGHILLFLLDDIVVSRIRVGDDLAGNPKDVSIPEIGTADDVLALEGFLLDFFDFDADSVSHICFL